MLEQDARSLVTPLGVSARAVAADDASIDKQVLATVLSVIAGSTDVVSFLGLAGLFTAHITGNLILIAARIVNGNEVSLSHILAVPVFILALALTRLLVQALETRGVASLRPLLVLQFLLLSGFLALCVVQGRGLDQSSTGAVIAGMLGVAAMAVHNGLVQLSLRGMPSTAVMTTNITRFTLNFMQMLIGRDADLVTKSRQQAKLNFVTILGFTGGAAIGALAFRFTGFWALIIPTSLALSAIFMKRG